MIARTLGAITANLSLYPSIKPEFGAGTITQLLSLALQIKAQHFVIFF